MQEYRKPEFEVSVTPGVKLARQGQTIEVTVNARYYFGQPVRDADVRLVVQSGPYYSPLRWVDSDSEDEDGGGYFYGGDELETLDRQARRAGAGPLQGDRCPRVTRAATCRSGSRRASGTPAISR